MWSLYLLLSSKSSAQQGDVSSICSGAAWMAHIAVVHLEKGPRLSETSWLLTSPPVGVGFCMEAQASDKVEKSSKALWPRHHHSRRATQTGPLVSGGGHTEGQPESDVGMYLAQRNSENPGAAFIPPMKWSEFLFSLKCPLSVIVISSFSVLLNGYFSG